MFLFFLFMRCLKFILGSSGLYINVVLDYIINNKFVDIVWKVVV